MDSYKLNQQLLYYVLQSMIYCVESCIILRGGHVPGWHLPSRFLPTFTCIVPFLHTQHQMNIFFSFKCFTAFVPSRTINIFYSNVWTVWQLYFILLGLMSRLMLCYNAFCDPPLAIVQQCMCIHMLFKNSLLTNGIQLLK